MVRLSDTMITAEDRERLAKSKFGEWFNEFFDAKFEEAMQKRGTGASTSEGSNDQGQQQQQQPQQQQQSEKPRRRSLLEACLSDTFGF